eukprot:5806598-Amphidinium_carterae.1
MQSNSGYREDAHTNEGNCFQSLANVWTKAKTRWPKWPPRYAVISWPTTSPKQAGTVHPGKRVENSFTIDSLI